MIGTLARNLVLRREQRHRRATSEYAIAAKCRRFPDATHQAAIAMTERELDAVSPQYRLKISDYR
jgi:hypothetical protein